MLISSTADTMVLATLPITTAPGAPATITITIATTVTMTITVITAITGITVTSIRNRTTVVIAIAAISVTTPIGTLVLVGGDDLDCLAQLYLPHARGKREGTDGLFGVQLGRRDIDEHESLAVVAQGVLQQVGQLAVAVWHMGLLLVQGLDDIA